MKTITASILVQKIDASVRDIENWIARIELSTKFHRPERGKARLLSRENALELAFIAGIVRGGALPSQAALIAAALLRHVKNVISDQREWFVFPAANLQSGVYTDTPDVGALQKKFDATTLSFVHINGIIHRVDSAFIETDKIEGAA